MTDEEIASYLGTPRAGVELHAAIVVTCKGRLAHLRQTLPLMLEHTPAPIVVVDWSCPEGSGDWAERRSDRVHVIRHPGERMFHKAAALNLGLRYAARQWGEYLIVLDADTMIREGLWSWIRENLPAGAFAFMQGHSARRDLSGLVVMHSDHYQESGGYDERMAGWGAEDWDMRARLHLKLGLPYVAIPWQLAEPIAHDDYARTRYQDGDKMQSYKLNSRLLTDNVCEWTGRHLHELDPRVVRPLFGGMW
jgi:hypothetical protein